MKSVILIISILLSGLSVRATTSIPDDQAILGFMDQNGIGYDSLCTNKDLYREIIGWIGVRYKYAGKSKSGVDCSGFVSVICNKIYGSQLSGSAGSQYQKCIPIEKEQLQEGDLVFFKIRKTYISHVGLYLGNGKFIHAAVHGGVMVNDLSQAYYHKYYFASGRLIL